MADSDPKDDNKGSLEDLLSRREELSPELAAELEAIIKMESEVDMSGGSGDRGKFFEVWVSDDKMSVMLRLYPAERESDEPQVEDIMGEVMEQKLSCPIDSDTIDKALKRYPLMNTVEIAIGRGLAPVDGMDGRLEWHVQDPTEMDLPKDDDQVDYRWHHHIVDVKNEEALVTVHPPTDPIMGKNVHGEPLPARCGRVVKLSSGKNTMMIKGNHTIYATCDGCVNRKGDTLYVEDLLLLPQGVNMETGNIETKCKVLIRGTVEEGFVVKSDQDIVVEGNIEAATVQSKEGMVSVDGGIIGKNRGLVSAKKGIRCRYANQSLLSSEGKIEVEDSLLHCTITCGESLSVVGGKHGVILGGSVRIRRKIFALRLGSVNEPRTDLVMGFDFAHESELRDLDIRKLELAQKLEELGNQVQSTERSGRNFPPQSEPFMKHQKLLLGMKKDLILLRAESEQVSKEIKSIEDKAFTADISRVEVVREVFPNTVFHMYRKHKRVDEIKKGLKVEIDPKQDEIRFLEDEK